MMFNDFGEEIRHGNKSDRVDLSKVAGCGDGDKNYPWQIYPWQINPWQIYPATGDALHARLPVN